MQFNTTAAHGGERIYKILIRGKANLCFLMFTLLAATCGCSQKWVPGEVHHQATGVLSMTNALVWRKHQYTIYPELGGSHRAVNGLVANIKYPAEPEISSVELHVFITPKTHKVWVGSRQDILIENDNDILGVRLLPYRGVQFTPSLLLRAEVKGMNVDQLSKYAETKYDFDAIAHHMAGESGISPMRDSVAIDLRVICRKVLFFTIKANLDPDQELRLEYFSIERGILRMELSRSDGKGRGTVWLRIADRTLIRAVENSVQVYPVEVK